MACSWFGSTFWSVVFKVNVLVFSDVVLETGSSSRHVFHKSWLGSISNKSLDCITVCLCIQHDIFCWIRWASGLSAQLFFMFRQVAIMTIDMSRRIFVPLLIFLTFTLGEDVWALTRLSVVLVCYKVYYRPESWCDISSYTRHLVFHAL